MAQRHNKTDIDHQEPLLYNRELSWLLFNQRVLELATDPHIPLLERLRFLTICSTNLDEFFEVRVAGLLEQIDAGATKPSPDGRSPSQTLCEATQMAHNLVHKQYALYHTLLDELDQEHIRLVDAHQWGRKRGWVQRYFREHLLPVLTPMGLDPSHPFPRVSNKSLNFMVELEGKDAFGRNNRMAVLQAPRSLPRVIALSGHDFTLLSTIIIHHVGELFPGMMVKGCYPFRLTRNSHLWVDEEAAADLMEALSGELPRRNYGAAVRLEVNQACPESMVLFLLQTFQLDASRLVRVDGPVNLHRLTALIDQVNRPDLKYPPHTPYQSPALAREQDLFALINQQDILLHHPYDSFQCVIRWIKQAAKDPQVLAVKITLYRTGVGSPIVDALLACCKQGKDVTVVIELRARFDEAANIGLANKLQEAGANVVYGVVGYKTHAKMMLIVRKHGHGLKNFVHVSTGNYHTRTAQLYTDIGLMTCDDDIGHDVQRVFQQLTGLGSIQRLKKLWHAPFTLHRRLIAAIQHEKKEAHQGRKAHIIIKANTLSEPDLIKHLYDASRAGVRIELLIRGVCCLKPGIAGLSENIRVRSIMGRFLEHARVFYFYANGQENMYCSSADWMTRNMFRRIEICFPIEDPALKKRIMTECLMPQLNAVQGAWDLQADGTYTQATQGTAQQHPQEWRKAG